MLVGPGKWVVLIVVVLLLLSYRKLPAISRSIGRSLRIAKGELKGWAENDVRTRARAQTGRGKLGQQRGQAAPGPAAEGEGKPADDER